MDRSNGNVSSTNNRRNINGSMSKEQKPTTNISNNKEILSKKFNIRKENKYSMLGSFIYGYKFSIGKIMVFKFIFFMMMTIDCWLEIPRCSNFYLPSNILDADRFTNSTHFPNWFDQYLKSLFQANSLITANSFLISTILAGLISFRIAFSMNTVYFEPLLLAALKFYMVMFSQSDNYQHHYLLVLVLIILSTINWDKLNETAGNNRNGMVSCWQLKLLIIQLSLVYFWTFIAKLNVEWINGNVLPRMVGPEFKQFLDNAMEWVLGVLPITNKQLIPNSMVLVSCGTIVTELFLVFSLHIKQLSVPTFILGVSMHSIMGVSGLRIGTFTYFMIIFYILSLPDNCFKFYQTTGSTRCTSTSSPPPPSVLFKLSTSLLLLIIGLAMILKLDKVIHSLFIEQFQISISIVLGIMVIQNLISTNGDIHQIKKQISLFYCICLLICVASKSRIEFRSTYIERGTVNIKFTLYDNAIEQYLLAKEIQENEWNNNIITSSNHSTLSNWLTGGINEQSNSEYIGDLGLFLESKNRHLEAIGIYEHYITKYPSLLKVRIGLLRCYSNNNNQLAITENKLKICNLLPETIKLATDLQSIQCHSQECTRNKGHAGYVLDFIKKLKIKC